MMGGHDGGAGRPADVGGAGNRSGVDIDLEQIRAKQAKNAMDGDPNVTGH